MTKLPRVHRAVIATLVTSTVLSLTACSGSGSHKDSASPSAPSTSASASASGKSLTARNPLTGVGAVPTTPLIVVKIDDTAPGRPQVGIDKADVVYIEAVEAGLTRLAAVFGTNKPTVGYVRSTRPSDPDLLRQYGEITEAFSGGQQVSRSILRRAGLHGWDFGGGAGDFFRVSRSESSYINLKLNLAAVAKRVKTNRPRSNGWTFAKSIAGLPASPGLRVDTVVTGSYSSGTPVEFRWDPKLAKYVRYINGARQVAADGQPVTATNVIVQACQVHSFPADRDVNGSPAQFTTTIGTGSVSVFRQGKRLNGTWSRAAVTNGTTLRTAAGKAIPLLPGNTWVVLVRKGIAVHG